MASLVRMFSGRRQPNPLLSGLLDADQRAWNDFPAQEREKAEAIFQLNAASVEVAKAYAAGNIDAEEAAERNAQIEAERREFGQVDQKVWVVFRRLLGWEFVQQTPALPIWAYSPEGVNDAPAHVVGPYIWALRCSILVLLGTQLLAFLLAAVTGFARSPLRWFLLVPSLVMVAFADWKVTRRFLVPYMYFLNRAEMNPDSVLGFVEVSIENLWVWAAYGSFSDVVAVVQSFTSACAAGVLFLSLRRGGVFPNDPWSLQGLEVAFLLGWTWRLAHFILPLVTTYRKGELTKSGFSGWGDHGKGQTLIGNKTMFNDDVALSLAEPAGASCLKSFANTFAQAHVKTARAPFLAVVTAASQATRLSISLGTKKVPLSMQLVLQAFMLKAGCSEEASLSAGEAAILANMVVGVGLSILDLLSMKAFEAMVEELVDAVHIAKDTGNWDREGSRRLAQESERSCSWILTVRLLVRLCTVIMILCVAIAVRGIVTVFWAKGRHVLIDLFWG